MIEKMMYFTKTEVICVCFEFNVYVWPDVLTFPFNHSICIIVLIKVISKPYIYIFITKVHTLLTGLGDFLLHQEKAIYIR